MNGNGTALQPVGNTLPAREAGVKTSLAGIEILVKETEHGNIVPVRGTMALDSRHWYQIPGSQKISLGAEAYDYLNKIAQLQVVTPQTVFVDGMDQRNPFIRRDSLGNIIEIVLRKLAVGRGPLGSILATDATLLYSPKQYFIRDILKKIKGRGDSAGNKNLGRIVADAWITEEDRATKYILSIGLGMSIICNMQDADFLHCLATYQEGLLFAERKAQTIARRLALATHPAMAIRSVIPTGGKVLVPMVGWKETDRTKEELQRMALGLVRGDAAPIPVEQIQGTAAGEEEHPTEIPTADSVEYPTGGAGAEFQPEVAVAPADAPSDSTDARDEQPPAPEAAAPATRVRRSTPRPRAQPEPPAPEHKPALTEKQRAILVDEVQAAGDEIDEGDYVKALKAVGWKGEPIETLSDDQIESAALALRKLKDA